MIDFNVFFPDYCSGVDAVHIFKRTVESLHKPYIFVVSKTHKATLTFTDV